LSWSLTLFDLVQQRNVPVLLPGFLLFILRLALRDERLHMQVLDVTQVLVERGKLVEVSCEEAETTDLLGDVSDESQPGEFY
jgi:hypothetical protein